jgi:colanic acid/amylovoran biosynthesis glycosyltransferase
MLNNLTLTILPSFKIKSLPNDQIVMTRKLTEAVVEFQKLWSGPVKVLLEPQIGEVEEVDQRTIHISELPFELEVIDYDSPLLADKLRNSVVLASVGYRQNHISALCRNIGSPCVYTAEYTLKTRCQIVNVTTDNVFLALRRRLWEKQQERRQRQAISLATGLQCNGFPIYEEYRGISQNSMIFLDTRITEKSLASAEQIAQRTQGRSREDVLRLVFSGRLNQMKGADHLLDVAQHLKQMGVNFHLYISGAGALESAMHARIQAEGLGEWITMMGVPDFHGEFLPFVKSNIDLFVCCHRQGDPSCTYIETMACGVPIVGYGNEAFAGLVEDAQAGWVVALDNTRAMAEKIAQLNSAREEITAMSYASLDYARNHTFRKTFEARVTHMKQLAGDRSVPEGQMKQLVGDRGDVLSSEPAPPVRGKAVKPSRNFMAPLKYFRTSSR